MKPPNARRLERLDPVGQRGAGIGMHLDDDPVGARRDPGERDRASRGRAGPSRATGRRSPAGRCGSLISGTAAMSTLLRVDGSKVRLPRSQITTWSLPRTTMNSAAARTSSTVDGHAALEEDREPAGRCGLEERAVVHVPCSDLHHVRVPRDQADLVGGHRLGDDAHLELVGHLAHDREPPLAETLEAVRGGPRLEGTTAEQDGAGRRHRERGLDGTARAPRPSTDRRSRVRGAGRRSPRRRPHTPTSDSGGVHEIRAHRTLTPSSRAPQSEARRRTPHTPTVVNLLPPMDDVPRGLASGRPGSEARDGRPAAGPGATRGPGFRPRRQDTPNDASMQPWGIGYRTSGTVVDQDSRGRTKGETACRTRSVRGSAAETS